MRCRAPLPDHHRAGRASIACAGDAPFREWGATFTALRLAAAVVDRLTVGPRHRNRRRRLPAAQRATTPGGHLPPDPRPVTRNRRTSRQVTQRDQCRVPGVLPRLPVGPRGQHSAGPTGVDLLTAVSTSSPKTATGCGTSPAKAMLPCVGPEGSGCTSPSSRSCPPTNSGIGCQGAGRAVDAGPPPISTHPPRAPFASTRSDCLRPGASAAPPTRLSTIGRKPSLGNAGTSCGSTGMPWSRSTSPPGGARPRRCAYSPVEWGFSRSIPRAPGPRNQMPDL